MARYKTRVRKTDISQNGTVLEEPPIERVPYRIDSRTTVMLPKYLSKEELEARLKKYK